MRCLPGEIGCGQLAQRADIAILAHEVIGGYWFIVASSLEEAARIAAANPCLACGLEIEIREVEPERAWDITNETPLEFKR